MTNRISFDPRVSEPKRVFLSRALALGAIAGSLEALLVLRTGIMPPSEIGLNFALLVAFFGTAAAVSIPIRTVAPLTRISGGAVLILVSVLPFALRGCLHNCGEDWKARVAVPSGILVLALLVQAASRRFRPAWFRRDTLIISTAAMSAVALDFAQRDGIPLHTNFLAGVLAPMAVVSALSAAVVNRGWVLKLVWTLMLALTFISWAGIEIRPLGLSLAAPPKNDSRGLSKPNVILVVMDTVRADHMSLFGYARKTSPNLERIASESLVFGHAVASGNYSLPSHASLLTGLLPSQHGAHSRAVDPLTPVGSLVGADFGIAADVPTLPEKLLASGYSTGGLSGNYVYLSRWTGLQRGFTAFDDRPRRQVGYHPFSFPLQRRLFGVAHQELVEWDAPTITRAGLSFAADAPRPFFLFLNYFDAHGPNFGRAGHLFRGDGLGSDIAPIPAYDSEIAYVDAAIGGLVSGLRRSGLLDTTIVIVTSDHGEFFGERGLHAHQTGGYEPVLHVPLLVRYPPRLRPALVSAPFGLQQIHRLILDLLEDKPVDWAYSETSEPKVLAQVWGRVADTDRPGPPVIEPNANIVYDGSFKLIDRKKGDDELYDLRQDPNEEHNLLSQPDPEISARQTRMQAAVARLPPARAGSNPRATVADLAALRGLGYISFVKPNPKKP